jgi:predicted lipid-binding transport protein (Tim44 family)
MGDGYQIIDIVVFAVIAGLLVLRLRSVLGRRTGTEQRRDPFQPPAGKPPADKVVPLPPRARPLPASVDAPTPLAQSLAQLKAADRSFDEKQFLTGARAAFEIIVNAFAKGDTGSLQPLLSPSVYASFAEAIRQREARQEKLETHLLSIKSLDIAEAALDGDTAHVTVKYVSEQSNATRAADGALVEGNPDHVEEKTDLWTFARPVRSRDPNWTLVATHSP